MPFLSTPPTTSLTASRLARVERIYSLVVALNWFATILPGAVIILFAQSRGLTLADVGLYVAVYGATAALLDLPTGNLADTLGRKRVVLLAYGCEVLAKLTLLFAFSLPTFLVYAVLGGLARALGSGALEAWFVNALRDIDAGVSLQPRLARVNTVALLALGAGSLLGASLPGVLQAASFTGTGLWSPLSAVVLASVVMHLLTLGVTWSVVHEVSRNQGTLLSALRQGMSGLPAGLREAARLIRREDVLLWLLLIEILIGLVLAATETYWQPFFAAQFGLGGAATGVFGVLLAGCFLAGVLGNVLARHLASLVRGRVGLLGIITQGVQAAALLALAWQGQGYVWLAAGCLWLTYFARAVFSSSFLALYNDRIPDARRSLMLSVLSVAMFLGFSLGNLLLGAVSGRWSISWAWTLVALTLVLSLGVYSKLSVRGKRGLTNG